MQPRLTTCPPLLLPWWRSIDWNAEWLSEWRSLGLRAAACVAQADGSVAEGLNRCAPASAVRFVPQANLPPHVAYERFVHGTGQVPTRDDLHDFFNGLAWLAFPHAKAVLNRLHAEAIECAAGRPQSARGPVRDRATLFDESGAVLFAPAVLQHALTEGDWQALFLTHRARWAEARLLVFGHALLEKLTRPRKPITAHVAYGAIDAGAAPADADRWLADRLPDWCLAGPKPFAPLPLLGVPGWWPANEQPDFYADTAVFRASKRLDL